MKHLPINVVEASTSETKIGVLSSNDPKVVIAELIESKSREYGIDEDAALAIARCESQLRQYTKRGDVLRGEVNPYDVGIFQINEQYHLEKSQSLGFDIYTPEGNVEYAVWLMSTKGRGPWISSRHCWHEA